jgi:hypothetical protein
LTSALTKLTLVFEGLPPVFARLAPVCGSGR